MLRNKFGFWSLSMYHRTNYRFVDNPQNKYAVRSGDELTYGGDGSLTLYIQTEPPVDERLKANWLPAPRDADFILSVRVYVGDPEVVTGKYGPSPAVPPEQSRPLVA